MFLSPLMFVEGVSSEHAVSSVHWEEFRADTGRGDCGRKTVHSGVKVNQPQRMLQANHQSRRHDGQQHSRHAL